MSCSARSCAQREASGLARERLENLCLTGRRPLVPSSGRLPGRENHAAVSGGRDRASPLVSGHRRRFNRKAAVAHVRRALQGILKLTGAPRWMEMAGRPGPMDGARRAAYPRRPSRDRRDAGRAGSGTIRLRCGPGELRLIFGSRCSPEVNIPRIRVCGSIRETGRWL
jgi:hypothetical protein